MGTEKTFVTSHNILHFGFPIPISNTVSFVRLSRREFHGQESMKKEKGWKKVLLSSCESLIVCED